MSLSVSQIDRESARGARGPRAPHCAIGPSRFVDHLNYENLAFSQIVTRVTAKIPVPQKFRKTKNGCRRGPGFCTC
jgi:hypothetical protein